MKKIYLIGGGIAAIGVVYLLKNKEQVSARASSAPASFATFGDFENLFSDTFDFVQSAGSNVGGFLGEAAENVTTTHETITAGVGSVFGGIRDFVTGFGDDVDENTDELNQYNLEPLELETEGEENPSLLDRFRNWRDRLFPRGG